jgi:uncharacterized protein
MNFTLPTTFIIKTTNGCNAKCIYCYEDNVCPTSARILSLEIIEKILYWSSRSGLSKVQIVWHGGEPLLAGQDYFSEMLSLASQYTGNAMEFSHSLQTNGLAIDASWIELFKQNRFGIGLSLDGPAWIHDAQRIGKNCTTFHSRVENALYHMIRSGLSVGLSCVVTRKSLHAPREIINYFNSLDANSIDFLPMSQLSETLHDNPLLITPQEFAVFMSEVLEEWLRNLRNQVVVRYFQNIIVGLSGRDSTLCNFSGRCGNYICVDYDGSVYPCDSFMMFKQMKMGDLKYDDLNSILTSTRYRQFRSSLAMLPLSCHSCKWFEICHGGCPAERLRKGSFDSFYPFCTVRKQISEKLDVYMRNLITK